MKLYKNKINKQIMYPLFIFTIISLVSIFSASNLINNKTIFIKQIIWYIFGYIALFITRNINIKVLLKNYKILYIIGNILLLFLLLFAPKINNSRCWFVIGPASIQISEFVKIILIITNSVIISKNKNNFILILKVLFITLLPSFLIFKEPDTGMVIIYIVISLFMLLTSKVNIKYFNIGILIFLLIASLFLSLYFYYDDIFINIFGTSFFYRIDRLLDWKNGTGYQLNNALTSTTSAGLFGFGFNNSPIYFPEAQTDFIFSIFLTNYGFIGALILIFCILIFDLNIINIAIKKKKENRYIIFGILSVFIYSQVQNIAMNIGLLPITGITLPFISYGGSSIISSMIMVGLILNIEK